MGEDRRDDLNFLGALGLVAAGAIIGAGLALVLARKTGAEWRGILQERGADLARRLQERSSELALRARETIGEAQVRTQDILGRGKEVLGERSTQLRAAFEAGAAPCARRLRGAGVPTNPSRASRACFDRPDRLLRIARSNAAGLGR